MNTASLELCQELYELSGWDAVPLKWFEDRHSHNNMGFFVSEASSSSSIRFVSPAYECGYLLRALPSEYRSGDVKGYLALDRSGINLEVWSAGYMYFGDHIEELEKVQVTPENALCELAITLFKEGVLKR